MKKSIALFIILIGAIVTIIFSCTRPSVPVKVSSCIQVALSSAAGTTSQTVAANTPISPITYVVTGSITGDTTAIDTISVSALGTLPPGVTGTFSKGIFSLSGTPTTSVGSPFSYTVTTTGSSCNNVAITGSITVTNCSNITLSSDTATASQTVAINSAITPITYTLGGGATGEFITGMPTGVTGTLVGSVLTISGTPTSSAGSPYTYTVTTTGGACTATVTGIIVVNHLATISLTSGSNAQTLSSGTALGSIKYAIGGAATGAVLAGAPSGITGSFAAGVFTISGTPTASGVFTYTVTTTGGGTAMMATGTITVTNCSTITLTSAIATASQTVAINSVITPITYTLGGGATGEFVTGMPTGVTGTLVGSVLTISGTPTNSAGSPYTYTVTTTGGACTATATGTITINSIGTATVTVPANIAVCNGSTVAATSFSSTPAGATYTWTNSNPAIGLAASGTGNIASFTAMNVTSSPITATITVTPTTTQGVGTPKSYTITVNELPTISLISGNPVQTLSVNNPIQDIDYTLGGGATGESVIGLPAGVTGTLAGSVLTISGTPTSSAGSPYTYTVTTTGGACTATATGTIIVNPLSTIVLTSGSATQTVSNGAALTNIVYTTGGLATGAVLTGAPSGITGSFAAGVFTVSGTPTTSGIFTYTVTTTGTGAVTATGTITVTSASIIVSCGITTSSSVQFRWALVTGATSYSVSYTINGGAVNRASTTASSFTVNISPGDVVVMTVTPIGTGSVTPSTSVCTQPS